ncbi:unnamed protein product [Sphagnum compactum]
MEEDHLGKPLLQKKEYPNCPGCKCAYLQHPDAKLPFKEYLNLFCLVLASSIPISSLYPFLYFMVQDFHIAKSDEDIGYYAGAIGAAFMIGQAITAAHWGLIADVYGRKPVIVIGLISVIVFHTLFGLSTNFWMALSSRFFLGVFNGMLGPAKAYASELTNARLQAQGMVVVSTSWGLGLVLGPAIGGYLSQPALKYPNLFAAGSLFEQFPYLLPSLCNTVFCIGLLFFVFQLPETLHIHDDIQDVKEEESATEQPYGAWAESKGLISAVAVEQTDNHVVSLSQTETGVKISLPEDGLIEDKHAKRPLFTRKAFIGVMIPYCLWALHDMAHTEVFSLWCISPRSSGGLSFTTVDVGNVLTISGFGMLVFQFIFFPPIANFFGPIMATRIAAMLSVPLVIAYPVIATLDGWMLMVILNLASLVKNILSNVVYGAIFLLINNSVPQDQRGVANGLSLCLNSISKAMGPAGGGSLFALGQTRQDAYILPGNELVFTVLAFVAVLSAITTLEPVLPRSTDHPYSDDDK